jgi:hypothetical protein
MVSFLDELTKFGTSRNSGHEAGEWLKASIAVFVDLEGFDFRV